MPGGPGQFVDHGFALETAILRTGEHAQRVVAQHLQSRPRLCDALAQQWVARGAIGAGDADDFIEFVLKLHLLAQRRDTAFEAEQGHGDFPAVARLADQVIGAGDCLIEKHFVELAGACQLLDRLHADLRLGHRHQQE